MEETIKDSDDITLHDIGSYLNDLLKSNSDDKIQSIVGAGFILSLEDDVFSGWYNGLLPGIVVHTNMKGVEKINERIEKLNLNK